MKIGIVGAGAIGGWIGTRLARRDHLVSVLARGDTLAALQDGPWRLDMAGATIAASVRASAEPSELGVQDVLILALKGPALPGLSSRLSPMIGPDTVIVPAMNGVPWWYLLGGGGDLGATALGSVDPGGVVARAIPYPHVLGCVVHASAAVRAPGDVVHKAGNRIILGEPTGAMTARLSLIADAFEDAGFAAERSDRIRYEIWYKLWGNMTMNPLSALTGATCDRLLDDPLVADWIVHAMNEAQAIGTRIGAPIVERAADRNAVTRQLGAFKTSMLQDVEAGRPLEIDHLLSAPREIAGLLGIATPFLDALTGAVRLFARTRGLYPLEVGTIGEA